MNSPWSVVVVVVIAASCTSHLASSVGDQSSQLSRNKRHVKPRADRPLTLEELHYQCASHGWSKCRIATQLLLNESSEINQQTSECLETAEAERSVQIKLKSPNSAEVSVAAASGPDASDSQLQSSRQNDVSNTDVACTVTMDQKHEARHSYCSRFSLISLFFVYAHMDFDPYMRRGLTGLAHCVDYYESDDLFTPQELVTSLIAWYKAMKGTHRCCNNYEDTGFFPLSDYNSAIESTQSCPHYLPDPASPPQVNTKLVTAHWDLILSRIAGMMNEAKCLEGLGRRRQCLRGCVSIEDVRCCS